VAPGKPAGVKLTAGAVSLMAPGDDLLCGIADRYEVLDRCSWRQSPVRPATIGR
jgi:hypothetical protein